MRLALALIESSKSYHFQEFAPMAAPLAEGRIWRICLIKAGWSKNRRYYGAEQLQEAAPLFEATSIAAYRSNSTGELDHLDRAARIDGEAPALNAIGVVVNLAFEANGPEGPGLYGDFHCHSQEIREAALTAYRAGTAPPFGFSIDADGTGEYGTAEGRTGLIVTAIEQVFETTLVSNPAAGGRFVRLIASTGNPEEARTVNKLIRFLERRLRRKNADASGVAGLSPTQLAESVTKELQEMDGNSALLELVREFLQAGKAEEAILALDKALGAAKEPEMGLDEGMDMDKKDKPKVMAEAIAEIKMPSVDTLELQAKIARLERNQRQSELNTQLRESLRASGLPQDAAEIVHTQFVDREFSSVQLSESINKMRSLLASRQPETGAMQEARVSVGVELRDRLVASVDLLFDPQVPQTRLTESGESVALSESEKEPYRQALRGGSPRPSQIAALWYDDPLLRGRRGQDAILVENVTADFPSILGTSINRRMAQLMAARQAEYDAWISINNDVRDFKQQDILIQHEIGGLPSVAESDGVGTATYTYGKLGGEERVQAAVTKYGRVFGITRETWKNDDLNFLRRLPQQLLNAGMYTEKIMVFRGLIGNLAGGGINTDTAYTGSVIYGAAHANLGALALSYNSAVAALKRKRMQRLYGATTTLSSGINASTTTIPVVSTRGFAADQQFQIGAETFTIATVDSATQFTVATRPGTTSHSSGAKLRQLLDQARFTKSFLVVPEELIDTAWELVNSDLKTDTANNNGNMLNAEFKAGRLEPQSVHSVFLGGDSNNWYMPSTLEDGTSIELGIMDGVRIPEVFVAEGNELNNMLLADTTIYKTRKEFYVKVVEPRLLDGSIVS